MGRPEWIVHLHKAARALTLKVSRPFNKTRSSDNFTRLDFDPDQLLQEALGLHRAGKLPQARSVYQRILSTFPDHADASHCLGLTFQQSGQPGDAVPYIHKAVELFPQVPHYRVSLSLCLREIGQIKSAIAQLKAATELNPADPSWLLTLGSWQIQAGAATAAIKTLETAAAIHPLNPEIQLELGNALASLGRHPDAIRSFQKALQLRPNLPPAHSNLGNSYTAIGEFDLAEKHFKHATELDPKFVAAFINWGASALKARHFDVAERACRRAIEIDAKSADAHLNLGVLELFQGHFDSASESLERAHELAPESPLIRLTLGTESLLHGDFARGLPLYEARLKIQPPTPVDSSPRWDGKPLGNKTLLILCEQGFGDMLMFLRFATPISQIGGKIIVESYPEQAELLRSVPGVADIVVKGTQLPQHDYHIPAGSIPLVMKLTLDTIPKIVPYVHVEPRRVEVWKSRLDHQVPPGSKRIAFVFAGRATHQDAHDRSIDPALLKRLEKPNRTLISIQYGTVANRVHRVGLKCLDLSHEIRNFPDVGAILRNVDLFVTVDTAAAHLAGALNVATAVMLPYVADWRWLLHRSDSVWYPSLKLFRQPAIGDWDSVVGSIDSHIG
jgi:tetratricopeptide (TPR) repeat protein